MDASTLTTTKFIRDTLFANLPLPFQKLRTYLWLLVFTRALGESGFGEWTLYNITLSMALGLASLNLGSSMMRFMSGDKSLEQLNTAWSTVLTTVLGSSLLGALGFLIFAPVLSRGLFNQTNSLLVPSILGVTLVTDLIFEEVRGFLRARRMNQIWAGCTLARVIPETVMTLAVGWWLGSVKALVLTYWLVSLVSAVLGVGYLHFRCGLRLVPPRWPLFKQYVYFGAALLPGGLTYFIAVNADRYIIKAYLDIAQVGIYSVAMTIAAVVFFVVGPINDVLVPELSTLYDQNEGDLFRQRFRGIQKVVYAMCACFTTLLFVFSNEVLLIATSRKFSTGGTALQLLGLQGAFMAVVMLYTAVLNVKLRVWSSTLLWSGMAIVILGLDMVLIPRFGIVGAAAAQLIAAFSAAVIVVGLNHELFRQTVDTGSAFRLLGTVALTSIVARMWPSADLHWGSASLRILGFGSTFAATLFVVGYFGAHEIRHLKDALLPARR